MQNALSFRLAKVAEADFPTAWGHFRIFGFEGHFAYGVEEALVLKMGDLAPAAGKLAPLVRVHSQCLTGDVFNSLRCDCRAQLELVLQSIAEEGRGLLIYEHQEGRGIGLLNKLRAYELQDQGLDTIEANERLGFASDLRSYTLPAQIARYFTEHYGMQEIRFMSNNPQKVDALEAVGLKVERVPSLVPEVASRQVYLDTKRDRMGHLLG